MSALAKFSRLGVAAALLAATLTACTSASSGSGYTYTSATTLGTVVPIGDRKKAEDVSGTLLAGGTTSLAKYSGHVVVVNFWASWCGPCQVETPQLDSLYRRLHPPKGIDVLGVNTKNEKSSAAKFVKDNDISFPVIFDEPSRIMLQLGNLPSASLPLTVLIDKHQRVAAVYTIRYTPKDIEPVLTKLDAES